MLEPLSVTLYARPGCHLCEEVTDHLEDLRNELPFTIKLIDITSDPAIFARLWSQIPVVEVAGTQLHAPIHPTRLTAVIADAVHRHSAGEP